MLHQINLIMQQAKFETLLFNEFFKKWDVFSFIKFPNKAGKIKKVKP